MESIVALRITALITKVEGIRSNLYPADWDADPLYLILQELRKIAAAAGPVGEKVKATAGN
ncbi:MAG: hypothetical protein GX973_03860 [Firmicutes bacterium]|nr:hypothetical protein [Bacillota bacterium]